LNNPAISIIYGTLFLILGNQNRGDIDVFSFFFFFSPLVGLALLSSSIVHLKAERNRLKALFSLTSMLNKMLPTKEWIDVLRVSFHELIDVDGMVIWTLENNKWEVSYYEGRVFGEQDLCESEMVWFEQLRKPYIVGNKAKEYIPAELFFNQALRSFIFAPLVIDNTTIGVLAVARVRTRSFSQEEVQAISTLANQLAIIIKTKTLIVEKEKRTLLEERNRIARDIHDGVAQTLAGALMKLETAQRKWNKSPEETLFLISDSMDKLRESLKQIRQSIYALRPYPTERVGMQLAMEKKMKELEQETSVTFAFEERGNKSPLSPMVEKILFDIFSESVQNILKHAEATKVEILLSYQKEHILFKIKDNGIGFSLVEAMLKARKEPHFGILQMNDAVEKISASLQIDSKPGAGTEISVCVPRMGIEGGAESNETYVSG
jgi:signal transduction histidine kinase